jgi:cold shock protein
MSPEGEAQVSSPASTKVRVEQDRGKQRVAEVLEIDTGTARPGENEPILRKPKT